MEIKETTKDNGDVCFECDTTELRNRVITFGHLQENIDDIIRRLEYVVDRAETMAEYNDKVLEREPSDTLPREIAYRIERRDFLLLNLLRQFEDAVCCGKGHHLLNWPTFEEMLNEQKRKDNEHGS